MRLTPAKIEDLVRKVLETLKATPGVEVLDESRAAAFLREVLVEDLEREDQLEEEVRALLRKHAQHIHGENLDYTLLFQRAKRQLAREKGIIL